MKPDQNQQRQQTQRHWEAMAQIGRQAMAQTRQQQQGQLIDRSDQWGDRVGDASRRHDIASDDDRKVAQEMAKEQRTHGR